MGGNRSSSSFGGSSAFGIDLDVTGDEPGFQHL